MVGLFILIKLGRMIYFAFPAGGSNPSLGTKFFNQPVDQRPPTGITFIGGKEVDQVYSGLWEDLHRLFHRLQDFWCCLDLVWGLLGAYRVRV